MEIEKNIHPPLARAITIVPDDDPDIAIYIAVTTSRSAHVKRDWDSALMKLATKVQNGLGEELWVLGQLLQPELATDSTWRLLAITNSEPAVIALCTTASHFYGKVVLNKSIDSNLRKWPRVIFPIPSSH